MALTIRDQLLPYDSKQVVALLNWSGLNIFIFTGGLLNFGDEQQGTCELVKIEGSRLGAEDRQTDYADHLRNTHNPNRKITTSLILLDPLLNNVQ